ncbi:class II peroxidase [Pleomassaria siparia CBS 279.74]|uniref:Peroxidase n=1 Tax=Pleomassaria siparia CBS 279.74 TaxID=1314801 RepID=A0A6G1KIT1_9PLEO|nr:class II peroxidase [Pleomassaria siparia CBS 279.74]
MKVTNILFGLGLLSILEESVAYPGMSNTISEIKQRTLPKRQTLLQRRVVRPRQVETAEDPEAPEEPGVLIGDIKDGGTTPIGKTVARILLETESGQSLEAGYQIPGPPNSTECKEDTCCIWAHISAELTAAFRGPSGRCNKWARAAVRLGFHDAGTWSQALADNGQDFGGADGSIALSADEIQRPENNGLQGIVNKTQVWQKKFGVGMGDLIQFSAQHAVVTCPLGPRIRTFVGRKDSSKAAVDGLLPGVNDSADKLIKLFEDKTISPHDLVALLGAHTTSEQFFVDTEQKGAPQDGTPGVWDTLFYNQTLGTGPLPKEVFRFPSDIVLSKDPRTADEWLSFSGPEGQNHWNEDYSYSYIRLSMLGVNNINNLTECTKVLPLPRPYFQDAGQLLVNE